jgi:hypothetical protein
MNLFKFVKFSIFPLLIYLFIFCLLTYPLILRFSSHFFADTGDGLQNVWNIWWVNHALVENHQFPLYTTYLHFPHGTTLFAHTLNLFNGLLGVMLLRFLTLTETFNFIIIFSFVIGAFIAFLLAYRICGSYWASLIAGFIFSFSNYHFAHTEGHLNLVSLEWIPLFLLCWFIFVTRPSINYGLGSAFALFCVILCDYYYFIYCILSGILITCWKIAQKKDLLLLFRRAYISPFLTFILTFLFTSAPLVFALIILNLRDPLIGQHDPKIYSLDLFSPFIPGVHWRFAFLTQAFWSRLPGNIHENSVHMGLSVILVIIYVLSKRKRISEPTLGLWFWGLFLFFLLGMGPVLHLWGKEITWLKLPYALLEIIFSPLKLGGVPIRMMVMVMLFASIICAIGFKNLINSKRIPRWVIIIIILFLFFEYLPRPIPTTRITIPEYVKFLKTLPTDGGVIDLVSSPCKSLYYQTIHHKPLAFGYLARIPSSVEKRNNRISYLIHAGEFNKLYMSYHFRYLVTKANLHRRTSKAYLRLIFNDGNIHIYELGAGIN